MEQEKIPKILVIDDDPFIVDMYVIKLKDEHFVVETARDGKEGLMKIKEYKPDVVLLDIVMPVLDGFGVLEALQGDGSKTCKVILLTNLGQQQDVERGMRLGADDYMIKAHFTPSEVIEKVKEVLKK
ncbi:MAG: response regulator [Patescibacteria group bacterium]